MFANVRWEIVSGLLSICVVLFILGLAIWVWPVWLIGLLGFALIIGDLAWTILSFAQAKRVGESKLKF